MSGRGFTTVPDSYYTEDPLDVSTDFEPLPQAHEQTLDELYQAPENFLEVEVKNPLTHGSSRSLYTDYEIICRTNIPLFRYKTSSVRRRYSDFEAFQDFLIQEVPKVIPPDLPGKVFMGRFTEVTIAERCKGLERFLLIIATHPIIQHSAAKALASFIQDPNWSKSSLTGI